MYKKRTRYGNEDGIVVDYVVYEEEKKLYKNKLFQKLILLQFFNGITKTRHTHIDKQ